MQSIKNTILKEDLAKIFADFTEKEKLRDSDNIHYWMRGIFGLLFFVFFYLLFGQAGD